MKFAGLTVLWVSIALTGIYLSSAHKKRVDILKKISLFFYETERLCRTGSYSLSEIFTKTARMKELSGLFFPLYISENSSFGDNLKNQWAFAIKSDENLRISTEAREYLFSFSDAFGKESREDFCKRCLCYADEFNKFSSEEKKKWEKNREITVYSGILAGAAVFFIFL